MNHIDDRIKRHTEQINLYFSKEHTAMKPQPTGHAPHKNKNDFPFTRQDIPKSDSHEQIRSTHIYQMRMERNKGGARQLTYP